MNILFVMNNGVEFNDSNANIGKLLIKKLAVKNQCHILTLGNSEKESLLNRKTELHYHILDLPYEKERRKYSKYNDMISRADKLRFLLKHPTVLGSRMLYQWHMRDECVGVMASYIEKICSKQEMDLVVAISEPFYIARAKILQKRVLYQLDPHS